MSWWSGFIRALTACLVAAVWPDAYTPIRTQPKYRNSAYSDYTVANQQRRHTGHTRSARLLLPSPVDALRQKPMGSLPRYGRARRARRLTRRRAVGRFDRPRGSGQRVFLGPGSWRPAPRSRRGIASNEQPYAAGGIERLPFWEDELGCRARGET